VNVARLSFLRLLFLVTLLFFNQYNGFIYGNWGQKDIFTIILSLFTRVIHFSIVSSAALNYVDASGQMKMCHPKFFILF